MEQFDQLTLVNLRKRCKELGLPTSGNKIDLVRRLNFYYADGKSNEVRNADNANNADNENNAGNVNDAGNVNEVGNVNELTQRIAELERTLVHWQTLCQDQAVHRSHFDPTAISTPYVQQGVNTVLGVTTTSVATHCAPTTLAGAHCITTTCPTATNSTSMNVTAHYAPTTNVTPQYAPTTYASAYYTPTTINATSYAATTNVNAHHVPTNVTFAQNAGPFIPNTANVLHSIPHPVTPVPIVPPMNQIVELLPNFDPMSKTLSSEQFLKRVELLMHTYNWNEQIVLFAVQQKMRGSAKYWMDSLEVVFTNWNQFASRFRTDFPCNVNTADVHIRMARTKRQPNETPQEFFYKMLAIGNAGNLPEPDIIRHIVNGINEADLKKKISNNYYFCHQLLQDINAYTTYNDVKTPTYNKPVNVSKFTTDKPKEQHESADNSRLNKYKCFNCGKMGHLAVKCPEPQRKIRCQICHRTTHTTDVCPNKQANIHKIQTENHFRHIAKNVAVNGHETMAFVDPGSKHTLIRRSFASEIGESIICAVILKGFAGGEYLCSSKLNAVVAIDDLELNTDMLLVDDELLIENVLLGQDILCRDDHRVIIEQNKCKLENINAIQSVDSLTHDEKVVLEEIITQNASIFAKDACNIGKCNITEPEIELTTDKPVCMKPYRIAFPKRKIVNELVQELVDCGIVRPSESSYASPVVLVEKKNGEHRLCVDYRSLNAITKRIPFPMPVMEEQFAQLAGSTHFSTLDLRMGYYQLEMAESSKKYTAFVTTEGHYEFNRMPFGLVNAPAFFQAVMNKLVARMEPGEVLCYLDDIIIPSRSVKEGLQRFSKFLAVLKEANLTLRMDKCQFLATEITHLGHIVNQNGIRPGENKITAIKNFKVPDNVREIRRFLGLTGFFRKFIQNYAVLSKPLTMLLHKSAADNFVWGKEQQESFQKLKDALCTSPVLALYAVDSQHEVHTDASSLGLAGVLMQSTDGKTWSAVSYFSRHCTDVESRYHAYELEVLAVVETLTRFRIYLLGKRFRLVTDCSAITKARTQKELIPKIARWYLKLMEYDFEAVHRPGRQLAHVDALSRAPNDAAVEVEPAGFVHMVHISESDWLLTMQLQDEQLKRIILVLRGDVKDDQCAQFKKEYVLKEARLFRQEAEGLKFVIPKAVRWRIVKTCHDDAGHFGVEKTILRIKKQFWFPKMRKYVKEYIAACIDCCYAKAHSGKPEGSMHCSEVEPLPFATLHLDHLGPFVRSGRGMQYVLAVSDAFSKFLLVKAVRSTKTGPVIATLNELTSYFGLPKRIITDRGTAFTSKQFSDYCFNYNIHHIKTAVRTPRANGQVERANQTILAILRTSSKKPTDWDLHLRDVQWAVNSQVNSTTGFTPNSLIFDFNLRDLVGNKMLAALHDDAEQNKTTSITERREQAADKIKLEREKWKERFDRKHTAPTEYAVDDLVVVEHVPPATGESRKLEPKYRGPYIIKTVLGNDRYVVADIPGMQLTQRRFESVYSADKIKRWCQYVPELDGDVDVDIEDDINAGLAELSETPCENRFTATQAKTKK